MFLMLKVWGWLIMLKVKSQAMMIAGMEFSPLNIVTEDIHKVLIVGDNGAGKSLFLKMMSLDQYRGLTEITINDEKINANSIAYISQLEFVDKYSAHEINRIMNMKVDNWDLQYYYRLLSAFEVDKDTPINQLSLGKRQRVEIAIGLAKRPKLLLIDEAFEGIDDISRMKIMEWIDDYLVKNEACLMMTTHSTFGLGENFDMIVHMHKGKVILQKDIENFKQEIIEKVDYPTDQSLDSLLSIYKDLWEKEKGDSYDCI